MTKTPSGYQQVQWCNEKTPPVITKVGGVTTNPSVITYNQWLPFLRASGVTIKPSVTKLP